jgi:hypothetical protein
MSSLLHPHRQYTQSGSIRHFPLSVSFFSLCEQESSLLADESRGWGGGGGEGVKNGAIFSEEIGLHFTVIYVSYCSCRGSESPEAIFLVPDCGADYIGGRAATTTLCHSRLYPPARD